MSKTVTYGQVKGGRLKLDNERRLKEDLRHFPDCSVQIEIKKRGKRSNEANSYYHAVIVEEIRIRLRDLGNEFDHDTVHEYLKQRFNSVKVANAEGEMMEIGKTTTGMAPSEFSEYLERIIQWSAEFLDLVIPPPSTQTSLFIAEMDETRVTIIQKA